MDAIIDVTPAYLAGFWTTLQLLVISGLGAFVVGDRVWTMLAQHTRPGGTAQEQVVLPVDNVTVLPDTASYDVGASLGVPLATHHASCKVMSRSMSLQIHYPTIQSNS